MADNAVSNPGSGGPTWAADDISGVLYARAKMVWGADGTATDVASGGAAVPIQDGGNSLTVDGTVTVNAGTGTFIVGDGGGSLTVDGTVSITGAVDTELTTADLDTGAGTDTRAVVGLVLAASGGGLLVGGANPLPISDNGGSLTIDGTVTADAGTGPWPVTDNGGSLTVDGTVTANAGTGTFTVGDGGGSLTIDGTVTANAGTGPWPVTGNGGSLTIDGSVSITGAVDTELTTADLDTGAGTDTRAVVGLVLAAAGGGLLVGSANPIPVSDNSGSLTVDGTVGATQSGTWTVQPGNTANTTPWLASIHDGTTKATVRDLAANDALNVAIVDGSGNQITSFGGGTQFAEDAAHTTGDVGTMALGVRRTADTSTAGTDGDYQPFLFDDNGFLKVNIKAGAGSGGTALADDAAFTVGTTNITPVGGTFRSTRDLVDDNDAGAFAMTQRRALLAVLETPNGDSAMDETNDALRVNVVAGSGGGVSHTDDAAFTPGTSAVVPMAALFDDTAPDSVDEGDAGIPRMAANRVLYTTLRDAAGNERGANVTAANRLTTSATIDAALPAGTNNIGDVDVLSVPAPLSTSGGGTEASALRVTIANDSTGVVSIDDNGSSLTVDGTVTANAGTGTFTVGDGGGSLTVDGTVGLSAGTNNIGDVDVLTLPASTKTIRRAVGVATASGNTTAIAAPGASKVIKVINYSLQAVGTVNAKFTDGAGGADLTMLWNFQAREATNLSPQVIPQFHFKCTANTALVLNLSAAVNVGFEITYWDDDAA